MSFLADFVSIVYPSRCLTCDSDLFKGEKYFCYLCLSDLPKTMHLGMKENPVYNLFYGRSEVETACALLEFEDGNKTQKIMHQLKYANNPKLGYYMGKILGLEMSTLKLYSGIDLVLPIPLHPVKKLKRGYNQSEQIAKGIADGLKIEMNVRMLKRIKRTESQTKRGRIQRWQNVSNVFHFKMSKWSARHILIVDDVVTTGSTLEAAMKAIRIKSPIKISVATLARSG